MIIPVAQVGAVGVITDLPPNELPLNAWTSARNVRFINGAVEKFTGHAESYASPNIAPYWLLYTTYGLNLYWLYAGLTAVGATDGSSHANITRAAGPYTTDLDIGWTGTVIEDQVVINNGVEVPQMWTPGLANDLIALTAWPATYTARTMRSLKRYLVALDITKVATRYPTMVKWSHQAPSGAVPASWDEADATIDAGEYSLSADGGYLIDGVSLRDDLILYKESQTWHMQYVGGIDIFRFTKRFSEFGMLTRKCALEFFSGKQVVFTGDDIVLHDGQQAESLIARRRLASITNTIDPTYYLRSFIALNHPKKEIWICFPETGSSLCTRALVWNWKENVWGDRDLPNASFITAGIVDPVDTGETWAGTGTWDTDSVKWGDKIYDPSQRKMLIADATNSKLFMPDTTSQFNAVNMTATLERVALGFPLKAGAPPDYTTEKLVRGVWPRIRGTAGGVVYIYVGTQERVDGTVTYDTAYPFIIGTSEYVDCLLTSKLHAIKFESTSNIDWILDGYDVDVVPAGQHGNR